MRQVVLRKGKICVEEVPAPLVENGCVLVETAYSLISTGTELEGMRRSGESLVRKAVKAPDKIEKLKKYLSEKGIKGTIDVLKGRRDEASPLGYSCSGVVVGTGEGVGEFSFGDMVACAGVGRAVHAELVLVPRNLVVKVPKGCDLLSASSVAMGAIAMQGVRRAEVRLGETVAVIGLGLVGQLTAQLLRACGCRVIGLDPRGERVETALNMGMEWGLSPHDDPVQEILVRTDGNGVDAAIITAAAPQDDSILQLATEMTRKKGRIVVVGDVGLSLKRSPFYEKELDLLISTSYGPGRYDPTYEEGGVDYPYAYVRWTERRNMEEYLRLLSVGAVDFKSLVGGVYPVEEAPEAYRALVSEPRPIGVILDYGMEEPKPGEEPGGKGKTSVWVSGERGKKKGVLNVALVGAGDFAKAVHLPNLKKLSDMFHLRAVVSATGLNALDTARRYGADYCTSDLGDVLQDEEVDMVIIATRHDLHAKMAVQACRSGKAVFLEKPLALNEMELDELMGTIRETQVPFTVGFNRRFSPAARIMREHLKERQGPLLGMYRVNAGYLPPEHWVHGPEGGGRIIGEACHMLDFLNFMVGCRVNSFEVEAVQPGGSVPRGDNVAVVLKYEDGSCCTLIYTALGPGDMPKEYVELFYDSKALLVDDFRELRVFGFKGKGWRGLQDKGHLEELRKFGTAVMNGDNYTIPLEDMEEVTRLTFIIDKALKCR